MSVNAATGSTVFFAGTKKQNKEINLLRLIFAFIIMINHFNDSFKIGVCSRGAIAVEFFFLVTGYLLTAHISKELQAGCSTHPKDVTISSFRYTLQKTKTFYAGYIINILLFVIIVLMILRQWPFREIVFEAFRSIPVFTLTFMGFNATSEFYISGSWYLSVMVISVLSTANCIGARIRRLKCSSVSLPYDPFAPIIMIIMLQTKQFEARKEHDYEKSNHVDTGHRPHLEHDTYGRNSVR